MKKTLAAILALLMITSVALVACQKKDDSPSSDDSGDDDIFVQDSNVDTSNNTGDNTDDNTDDNNDDSNIDNTVVSKFEAVSKTVYAVTKINLRNEPSAAASAVAASVGVSTALTVVAQNNEWYQITYNGETMYVNRDYVSSRLEETQFSPISEDDALKTLTLVTNEDGSSPTVFLRTAPSFHENEKGPSIDNVKVTSDKPLQIIEKNAIGTWYKVEFEGKNYYLAINSVTKPHFNELKGITDEPARG